MRRHRHTDRQFDHRRCGARAGRSGRNLRDRASVAIVMAPAATPVAKRPRLARSKSCNCPQFQVLMPVLDSLSQNGPPWRRPSLGRSAPVGTSGRFGIKHGQRLAAFISAPLLHFRTSFCEPAAGTSAVNPDLRITRSQKAICSDASACCSGGAQRPAYRECLREVRPSIPPPLSFRA